MKRTDWEQLALYAKLNLFLAAIVMLVQFYKLIMTLCYGATY